MKGVVPSTSEALRLVTSPIILVVTVQIRQNHPLLPCLFPSSSTSLPPHQDKGDGCLNLI